MVMRECLCCAKWWDVEIGKEPKVYRKRTRDGLIHDFQKHIPPRHAWQQVKNYCIVCLKVHIFFIGPVTGKFHSNECNTG